MAYRQSQDTDGKRTQQEEVEIIGCQTDRGVTTYIVRTQDGIECTAMPTSIPTVGIGGSSALSIARKKPQKKMVRVSARQRNAENAA